MKDKIEEPECGCGLPLTECMPDFGILTQPYLEGIQRLLENILLELKKRPTSLEGNAPEGGG